MMKKTIILFVLAFLPLLVIGQAAGGQITRSVKKQETPTNPAKKQTTPAKKQTTTPTKSQTNTPAKKKQANVSKRSKDAVLADLVNNMVRVEGGTFMMGATSEQGSDAYSDEKPAHQVTLSPFSIGKYEVTQEEWEAVMGSNPSHFKGAKRPVECVSWNDCQEFISKLNVLTGKRFRLPTEAEWEYAARGGNRSFHYKYAGSNNIGTVAWYDGNAGIETYPVGQKQSNELGLYDMVGNVWEWCQDWYDSSYYGKGHSFNPVKNTSASYRVYRGGSWNIMAKYCRVSSRGRNAPGFRNIGLGFRLAL